MKVRLIYWGAFWLILPVVVYGITYFSTKQFLPPRPESEVQEVSQPAPQSPPPEPILVPPFDEKELKPASAIWQRWENLKKETDMPVE